MARNTVVVVAEVLTILALILAGLFNFGGLSVKSELDDRYLALIDASDITSSVSKMTYQGLPDSHDYSKHKDVFVLYIYGYCSGSLENKDKTDLGRFKINFCSRPMSELFDQYRVWKVWGVDLATPKNAKNEVEKSIGVTAVKTIPLTIMGIFTMAVACLCLTILFGFMSYFFTKWGVIIAAVISTISSTTLLIVASLCQSLYPTLVNRTNDHRISSDTTKGTLKSQYNQRQLSLSWLIGCLSAVATVGFIIGAFRASRRSSLLKHGPKKSVEEQPNSFGGLVRRTTDRFLLSKGTTGAYRKIDESGDAQDKDRLMAGRSHARTPSELDPASGDVSRDGSRRGSFEEPHSDYRGLGDEESKYEPMRHRPGGEA